MKSHYLSSGQKLGGSSEKKKRKKDEEAARRKKRKEEEARKKRKDDERARRKEQERRDADDARRRLKAANERKAKALREAKERERAKALHDAKKREDERFTKDQRGLVHSRPASERSVRYNPQKRTKTRKPTPAEFERWGQGLSRTTDEARRAQESGHMSLAERVKRADARQKHTRTPPPLETGRSSKRQRSAPRAPTAPTAPVPRAQLLSPGLGRQVVVLGSS